MCTRSDARHPFPTVYPTKIGHQNASHEDASAHGTASRSLSSTFTHLIWEGTTNLTSNAPEQQVVLKVPLVVNTTARTAALNHKPLPYALQPALHAGKLVHYTVEAPLFRYRTMLKVSLVRSGAAGQALCAPVFGEIFILPPKPETDAITNTVQASFPNVNTLALTRPAPRADQAAQTGNNAQAQDQETLRASPVGSAEGDAAPSRVRRFSRSEVLETPRSAAPTTSTSVVTFFEDPSLATRDAITTEGNTAPAPVTTALAPTRPMSGNGRPSRSARNSGGIASFRAQNARAPVPAGADSTLVAVPVGAGAGGENVNPNIASAGSNLAGNKTPHAKPTRSSHVIRVDAELISRGPAAVVIDRQERRNEPIRTPQRFAVMYQCKSNSCHLRAECHISNRKYIPFHFSVGTATVIDGTPVVMAPTPNVINTVEFRANRRNFAHYPPNTAERGALFESAGADEPETPRCVAEGFQYNCAVDSHAGTPEPPRRYSISESFDGQVLFDDGHSLAAPAVAMPLPAESALPVEAGHLLSEARHGASPRQRQLFRGTFDGVDWLALNHSTSAAALDTQPNTTRSDVPMMMTLDTVRTAGEMEMEGVPLLIMPATPMRPTGTAAC